ncbi:MAG: hypothetical protein MH204_06665 [Fimbriimonadaceae bacterium]|nr:hypothetical protein [Fimbriimonadaceae bacterium]
MSSDSQPQAPQLASVKFVALSLALILGLGLIIALAMMIPVIQSSRMSGQESRTMTQLRAMAQAALLYSEVHDHRHPEADWMDRYRLYVREPGFYLRPGVAAEGDRGGFSFNETAKGAPSRDPENSPFTPIIFPSLAPTANAYGRRADLVTSPDRPTPLVLADGMVRRVEPADLDRLSWDAGTKSAE